MSFLITRKWNLWRRLRTHAQRSQCN